MWNKIFNVNVICFCVFYVYPTQIGSEDAALLLLPRATKYDDLDQALLFCQRRIQYRSIDCEQLSAGST